MWETCHSETIQSQEFPIKVSVFYQLSYIDTVGKESIFCCNNLYPNAPLQAYLGVTVKDEEMEELKIVVTSCYYALRIIYINMQDKNLEERQLLIRCSCFRDIALSYHLKIVYHVFMARYYFLSRK